MSEPTVVDAMCRQLHRLGPFICEMRRNRMAGRVVLRFDERGRLLGPTIDGTGEPRPLDDG